MTNARRADSPLSPLMIALEEARGLDRVVAAARPLMEALTSNEPVRDALQGRRAGHAVHPALVQVPLGAWTSALLLDLAGGRADDDGRGSQLLTGIGLACAVPTAVTGWAELAEAGQKEKRVGVVHAAANATGMVLQGVALWQRGRGRRGAATATAAAAMAIMGAAGYIGGHLAVARDVGSKDRVFGGRPGGPDWVSAGPAGVRGSRRRTPAPARAAPACRA